MATVATERLEDRRLLLGAAAYVGDVRLEGQLAMAVVRSNVAHGFVRGVDGSAARRVPGVRAVLTAADLGVVPSIPIRRAGTPGMELCLQPVLAGERVRYVGEPLAVVVASDRHVAEDAAELVDVDIEPLDAVVDSTGAESGPVLHDAAPRNRLYELHAGHGDLAEALARAAILVREEVRTGRQTGLPIETRGLLARWRPDGTLDLWGPTKFVHFTRQTLAAMLGFAPESVVVHHVDVGGMFGTRGELYPEDFLVPWAARVVGAPVQWIEDRREHLLTINHSRETVHRVELGVASDGTFLSMRDDVLVDAGAYSRPIGARIGELVLETMPGPYRWEAYDLTCAAILTNKTPIGTMRGPSGLDSNFVRERLIDIAASRLGMDPIELRRRNLIRGDEMPFERAMGANFNSSVYDTGDYPALFDEILERAGFDRLRADVAARQTAGEAVGVGVGLFLEASGFGVTESASVRLDGDGRFVIGTSANEIGQGLGSTLVTVAAEALDVEPDRVVVELGSSTAYDGGHGTFGSRTTIFVGSAVQRACDELLAQRDAEGVGSWEAMAPREVVGVHDATAATIGFGAHVAHVAVDPGTGRVTVEGLTVGYDCGRALRPDGVAGQLIGATVGAVGGTLLEELRYDASGQPLSTTFMDYLVPTCADVPRVEAIVLESGPVPGNPLGVKGAGEAGVQGVAGAIVNAVADAIGAGSGLLAIPLRPEHVVDAWPAAPVPTAVAENRATAGIPWRAVASATVVGAVAVWWAVRRDRRRSA